MFVRHLLRRSCPPLPPSPSRRPSVNRGLRISNRSLALASDFLASLTLHLAPHAYSLGAIIERNVGGLDEFTRRNVAQKLDVMRKPDGQCAERKTARRRNELGVDGVAALAVECFTRLQGTFGNCDRIAAKAAAAPGRLATQCDVEHRDRGFQPNQMKRLVHRRVTAAWIGGH